MKMKLYSCLAILLFATSTWSQFINEHGPQPQQGTAAAVEFLAPDQVSIPAGKPTHVQFHFRVAPGLHMNSHTPYDQFLIPTVLSIMEGKGVRLESVAYPRGAEIALVADPKTKLSVYSGEFTLDAVLVAKPGRHLLEGKLRYQACNQTQCLPPKTIPVAVEVTGISDSAKLSHRVPRERCSAA